MMGVVYQSENLLSSDVDESWLSIKIQEISIPASTLRPVLYQWRRGEFLVRICWFIQRSETIVVLRDCLDHCEFFIAILWLRLFRFLSHCGLWGLRCRYHDVLRYRRGIDWKAMAQLELKSWGVLWLCNAVMVT